VVKQFRSLYKLSTPQWRARKRMRNLIEAVENPRLFARVILRHRVWSRQDEILHSVAKHSRTAVKACHASGKTFTAAEAVLWWITRRQQAVAITTAPTWTQVEHVLWNEIRNAASGARIKYPQPTATELRLGPGRYAMGLSTNEGVRFQGFHGSVLIVLDEAPGVLPEIWEAIEGIRASGDVRVLALGNPTIASGPFYDAFTSNREGWNLITISAFDTPNLAGLTIEQLLQLSEQELNQNECPYLTTRGWVREKYHEWSPGHPLWESRVLGNFPSADPYGLIPLSWIELARIRESLESTEDVEAGVDVAEGGENETVACVRRGGHIIAVQGWSARDARGPVTEFLNRHGVRKVKVDKVGVGAYFEKHLRDLGFQVLGINVGEAPSNRERFVNLKAELYWALRERFEAGQISGAFSERTVSQLAAIRYELTAKGQIAIEGKEKMARRGAKSPDWAEALMLAFAPMKIEAEIPPIFSLTRECPWTRLRGS
jgi:hypothetical protein